MWDAYSFQENKVIRNEAFTILIKAAKISKTEHERLFDCLFSFIWEILVLSFMIYMQHVLPLAGLFYKYLSNLN